MYIYTINKSINQTEKVKFNTLNNGELFSYDGMSYMKITGTEPNCNAVMMQTGEAMWFESTDEVYSITSITMKGHISHG